MILEEDVFEKKERSGGGRRVDGAIFCRHRSSTLMVVDMGFIFIDYFSFITPHIYTVLISSATVSSDLLTRWSYLVACVRLIVSFQRYDVVYSVAASHYSEDAFEELVKEVLLPHCCRVSGGYMVTIHSRHGPGIRV